MSSTTRSKKASKSSARRNMDDTSEEEEVTVAASDPSKPWLEEWNLYIQTHETVPEGMGIVCWWGVHSFYLFD